MTAALRLIGAGKDFSRSGRLLRAVDSVDLALERGETLGVVGESGSGKSTLGRLCLGLLKPDRGRVELLGEDLSTLDGKRLRALRADTQCVFQEPLEALDPHMRVGQIIAEPLVIHERGLSKSQRNDRVAAVLDRVGLPTHFADRRPRDLSGGQQQRVGIARAVVTEPKFLVLDEPTSSLDLSVRAGILQLLRHLHATMGLTYLAISHDLGSVRYVCDRVAVMYRGRIVELGDARTVLYEPLHPYTRALVSASLTVAPERRRDARPLALRPSIGEAPQRGCPLVGRCPIETDACATADIPLIEHGPGHFAACIRAGESAGDVVAPPNSREAKRAMEAAPAPDRAEAAP